MLKENKKCMSLRGLSVIRPTASYCHPYKKFKIDFVAQSERNVGSCMYSLKFGGAHKDSVLVLPGHRNRRLLIQQAVNWNRLWSEDCIPCAFEYNNIYRFQVSLIFYLRQSREKKKVSFCCFELRHVNNDIYIILYSTNWLLPVLIDNLSLA